jgi:nicotinate-nucleotide pyrophosphorylase (carboxylating)
VIPQDHLSSLIELAIAEDFGAAGDLTSRATMPENTIIQGNILAKSNGILAGLEIVSQVYAQVDSSIIVKLLADDGDSVIRGTRLCKAVGPAQSVLAGERVALNFLQRLSGIATLTRRFVDAVAGTKAIILDTRKTTPGWRALEKYAVRMGGGQNHRMGLYDMLLIKDNHIDAAGSITAAVNAARAYSEADSLTIEVEVKDEAELREALTLDVDRILLDNMSLAEMRRAVQIAAGRTPLEASGNVTLETVRAIAETGVDFISVGALTHSAPILDLSMRLVQQPQLVEERL